MGRAIYGAVGGPDPHLAVQVAALTARVRELEAEVARLREQAAPPLGAHELDVTLLSATDSALV